MISLDDFLLFALASLMLNITPGNDMLYVATRSASQGVKAGIVSSLGIAGGCLVHLLAAVIGLSVSSPIQPLLLILLNMLVLVT
jgi:threonine/homoserine/homoserine lactone efflux protein